MLRRYAAEIRVTRSFGMRASKPATQWSEQPTPASTHLDGNAGTAFGLEEGQG